MEREQEAEDKNETSKEREEPGRAPMGNKENVLENDDEDIKDMGITFVNNFPDFATGTIEKIKESERLMNIKLKLRKEIK